MDMSSPDTAAIESLNASESHLPSVHFDFENTYARLPENFYARLAPTPVGAAARQSERGTCSKPWH